MQKSIKKRLHKFLSIAIALIFIIGLLPLTAAAETPQEQFDLTPGGTYYFDLSGEDVPGTINTALPDKSLKWVPFTYVGTVNAYSLTAPSSSGGTAFDHSLFVANFNVTHTVSWDGLNNKNLIFGKTYETGGVDYTLRTLSVGSASNGQTGNDLRGTPETNEWDQILNKGEYIKNYLYTFYSWGQDTYSLYSSMRALRGYYSTRLCNHDTSSSVYSLYGWRPALEILNPDTLGADALKAVTYDMGSNGTLGSGSLTSATVVYTGTLTLPDFTTENGFNYPGATGMGLAGWYDDDGAFYQVGTELTNLPTGTILTAAWISSNADLSALSVGTGSLGAAFKADTVAYSVDTEASLNSIEITAETADPNALITIGGQTEQSGVPVYISLDNGENLIPIVITAQDGVTQKAYIISVNGTVSNADLSRLSLSPDVLSFDAATTDYYVTVGSDVTSIDLTASADDSKAVMLLDGAILSQDGTESIPLSVGDNTAQLMVIAQDATTKIYTVTINRGTSDATLSGLSLSAGTLSPSFNRTTYAYTATVANDVTSLTASPTAFDNAATVTVNGQDAATPVNLSVGSNTITIEVTGRDGVTTKTYTVTVTRQAEIEITNASLPVSIVGGAYSVTMAAEGGDGSFVWSATGLPSTFSLDSATGILSGTPVDGEGTYSVTITATDGNTVTGDKSYTLVVQKGCGNGAYLIVSDGNTAYTGSYTDKGIPTLTVNDGVSGFTYFRVNITTVTGHAGEEVCLFVHIRNEKQIGFSFVVGNFDGLSGTGAAFNVQAGDVIMVYIVDELTNGAASNPNVL